MKIQPVGDKLLIKPIQGNISSVLEVPAHYLSSEAFGEVVRLGTYNFTPKGKRTQDWPVKVGDRVSYGLADDIGMKLDDEDHGECLLIHIGQLRTVVEA